MRDVHKVFVVEFVRRSCLGGALPCGPEAESPRGGGTAPTIDRTSRRLTVSPNTPMLWYYSLFTSIVVSTLECCTLYKSVLRYHVLRLVHDASTSMELVRTVRDVESHASLNVLGSVMSRRVNPDSSQLVPMLLQGEKIRTVRTAEGP
jgi:hypothetical protein